MKNLELRKKFGKRLQTIRKSMGVSQKELAEASEISVKYLSELERGLSSPTLEVLDALAEALSIDPGTLFPGSRQRSVEGLAERQWFIENRGMTVEQVVQILMQS